MTDATTSQPPETRYSIEMVAVLRQVAAEHDRAIALYPNSVSLPDGTGLTGVWQTLLAQARAANERAVREGTLTHALILEEEFLEAMSERSPEKLRVELVQVAAMAVKWVIDIDRRAARSRGVAGDRCESGNECGRIGCPECQQ